MESIDGTIREIRHQGRSFDGGTFVIAKIDGGASVVGDLHDPRVGETYRFFGEWGNHPKFGRQYKFTTAEVIVDMTTDGVTQYLRNYIDGLGLVKASAIVEHFGVDTLTVLRGDPDAALAVPRITPAIVEAIRKHFDDAAMGDPATEARLLEMFRGVKFPRRIVKQLMRAYKSAAADRVMENPYLLLQFRGIGWKLVDSFATTVAGYDRAGIARHRGAIKEAFESLANDGHTCQAMARVNEVAGGLLGMPAGGQAWADLAADGEVVGHLATDADRAAGAPRMVALAKYANAESEVARRIARLLDEALPLPGALSIDGLADEQAAAVRVAEAHGVSIITGAPGSGKSVTVGKIIGAAMALGIPTDAILVIAPTGKAARRSAEVLHEFGVAGVACSTIHRALAPSPQAADAGAHDDDAKMERGRQAFGFARNEGNPLAASLIVIEECSMLDVKLAASLFRAIRPGTRVVIVGDENQLPSVGAGSFLRDLLAAGLPSFTLREIRRSDSAGTVVHACHAIRDGRMPVPADAIDLPRKNWVHVEVEDPVQIANTIINLHRTVRTFDPVWGMQVVTPQKARHPFATGALNQRLACLLNPVAAEAAERADAADDPEEAASPPYYVGDKVIRTENGVAKEMVSREQWEAERAGRGAIPGGHGGDGCDDDGCDDDDCGDYGVPREEWSPNWRFHGVDYRLRDTPIVNGDLGTVIDVVKAGSAGMQVVVALRSPDRLVRLPHGDAKLMQAYALTCHKMQGSSADYVVVPVHHAVYAGLFTREWIYTAISRTGKVLVTVGPFAAIESAIGRKTVHLRKTRLAELIRAEMADVEGRRRRRAEERERDERQRADRERADRERHANHRSIDGSSPGKASCLSILGLAPPVTLAAVKSRFRELAMAEHPDRGGTHAGFVRVREAYAEAVRMVRA